MSNAEYANLIDFLSGKFSRIDAQFEAVDRRFDGIDRRFDGSDQRFDGIDQRLDRQDQRLTRLEVSFEEFRHDMRAVAELARQNAQHRLG